jgi:Flp pilus assembly protein TadB
MEYNIKDFTKGEKLEETMKRYVERYPDTSSEELQEIRELFKNASEEEMNKLLFESFHRIAEHNWKKLSVVILTLGCLIAYIAHSWWILLVAVVLALVLMCIFIYLNMKFLEKYVGISVSEQEILNRFRCLQDEPKSEE